MRASLIVLALSGPLLAAPKPGDEGTQEYKKATELVHQLGSSRFAEREAAAKELIAMGGIAVPALSAGTRSTDAEIRNRSVALLPKAVAAEWDRRATAFLADPDNKSRDLPLLAELERFVGPLDAGSRKLFAEMLRAHGPLLELTAVDRKAAGPALDRATRACLNSVRIPGNQIKAPTGDWAALLFLDSIINDQKDHEDRDDRSAPPFLIGNPGLSEAIVAKEIGPSVRRLLVRWINSRPKSDTMSGLMFPLLAYRKPFPESVAPLISLVKEAPSPLVRVLALEALGRNDSKDALDALNGFLGDTSIVYTDIGGEDAKHQVRDCALAALANRANRSPTDFGLTSYLVTSIWFAGTQDSITIRIHGFSTVEGRKKGLQTWNDESGKK